VPERLVIGNWKMHTERESAAELARDVVGLLQDGEPPRVTVGVAPPYPFLSAVGVAVTGAPVELCAQDCHPEPKGAFTGSVSAPMLASLGVARVIVGHSERRHGLGEDDDLVRRKLDAALGAGLGPVLCVGETLEEREAGQEEAVVRRQLEGGLQGLDGAALGRVVVAYEPVWAIGTGRTATPEQAGAMHRFIHALLADLDGAGAEVPVLYGGSVKPQNIAELAATDGIDGALVGGASLEAESFVAIVRGATD